ncbi:MAG: hypothetical protein LBI74_02860 [Synergistaceae bacterium]|jgi:hypothetical protein|nr:hypothetical protein [Synergistaceae bacterium]
MIHDIPKPEISADFTIDDIRKIRDWHYEILKDATNEEQIDFYHRESEDGRRAIEEIRRSKEVKAV